ncbi:MAG: hypothetical protein QM589_15360 [Thermomicrobiales bacterium]
MWDPRTYEDTDYGLDDGESFEPDLDLDDEHFDPTMPHIMTVLGPIEPEELGVCIPATRFLPERVPGQPDRERSRALAEAADELEAFASVGGRGVVDIATARSGRDTPALQRLTQLVPSHIVTAAGLGSEMDDPVQSLMRELEGGIDRTGVHAGLIAIRTGDLLHDGLLERTLDVAVQRGMPLLIEMESWDDAPQILSAQLRQHGITSHNPAPHLILTGPGTIPDAELIAEAAQAGAFVTLRTGGPGHHHDETLFAQRIVDLGSDGLDAAILITMDLVAPRVRLAMPVEPRSPYLIDRLALSLMNAGASALDVRRIMIENPARALTIFPPPM